MKVAEASIQIMIWIKNDLKTESGSKIQITKTKFHLTFEADSIEPTISEDLELTYPTGYMTKCTLPKASYINVEITCIL